MTVLLTGSEGLIGRHLTKRLLASGIDIKGFDLARSANEDVRHPDALERALRGGISGVIHLAAVSRVIWAERSPQNCIETNVNALEHLLRLCATQKRPPWVLFVSSREVYGNADAFPVPENATFQPMNVYARSKVAGEQLVRSARDAGLVTNICRLSSVYGCPLDYPDRVAMAFAGAAARGGRIVLEGRDNVFDFTSVHDVTRGLELLIEATIAGEKLPAIHFVSGKGTSLTELAQIACRHSLHQVEMEEAAPRTFDVARFIGDPRRALSLLGWKTKIDISDGLPALVKELSLPREHRAAGRVPATA